MRRADPGEAPSGTVNEDQQRGDDGRQAALQTARRAEADQVTNDEPEIKATRMSQDTLQDVS